MTDFTLTTKKFLRADLPDIKPGMEVRVRHRVKEGGKWRSAAFVGTVIARKHGKEVGATITVRRVAAGDVGVEIVFPLHSPLIEKIEILQKPARVRRAKLYYLRERSRREARAKLKTA